MTTIAQDGILGFGPSTGKGIAVSTGKWYRHKATMIDLGVLDDQRMGPPEVGGTPLPTMPYKAGVMVGGGATINPRLKCSLGWLLYGALGAVSTTSGSGSVKNHVFKIDSANPNKALWMGFRKFVPSSTDVGDYTIGETYNDCKITNIVLTLPNDGLISTRVDVLGRSFTLEQAPDWGISSGSTGGWDTTDGEFEDYTTVPIGCVTGGYINVPTFGNLPVVAAQIGWQNMPLDTRNEKIYGSPFLDDVTVVSRALTLDLTCKWQNPDLYRQILTNSTGGTIWSAVPFTTAVEIVSLSPGNITGESIPYRLKINVTKAMLAMNGSIQLAGGQAVMMRFTGTGLEVVGSDYATFELRNGYTAYSWT
jgi:hypothetical protein